LGIGFAAATIRAQDADSVADTLLTMDEILEHERQLAQREGTIDARLPTQDDLLGRLVELDFIARLSPFLEPSDDEPLLTLPLKSIAQDPKILKHARVKFDADRRLWSATWRKPKLFHFGNLLKPSLEKRVKVGEEMTFECDGLDLAITKSSENELELVHGDSRRELKAKDLERLLKRSISAQGLELFVDKKGNLVLKALGEMAMQLQANNG
jgi:hypothetical protein